jgi:hypothetical protein
MKKITSSEENYLALKKIAISKLKQIAETDCHYIYRNLGKIKPFISKEKYEEILNYAKETEIRVYDGPMIGEDLK